MISSKTLGMSLVPITELRDVDRLAEMLLTFPLTYSVRLARNDAATLIDFNRVVDDPMKPNRQTLLAMVGGESVGFVTTEWNDSHAVVRHLAIHSDHQGLGYLDLMVKLIRPYVFEHLKMETCAFDVLSHAEKLKGYCERRDMYKETWQRKSDNGDHDLHRQIVSRGAYRKCLEDHPDERVDDLQLP